MRHKILSFLIIMMLVVSIIPFNQNEIENLATQAIKELEAVFEESNLAEIFESAIKPRIDEITGEIISQRGQNYRHYYNSTTDTYTYRSDNLVYKENVIADTNWITFNEYPIRYVFRLTNGSVYFLESISEINTFFTQITNSSLWGVGVESYSGLFGFYLDIDNVYAHGQYLYYPRLSSGKLTGYNQPLYAIFPHLYARIGATLYDQILNDKSLYQAQHDPRNNLFFEITSDTFALWFNTFNFDVLGRTWDFTHGLKYNTTDQKFHLITEFRCRNQDFNDIGMAYEIISSPQSDGTPYQPSEFLIYNDTHERKATISQAWDAGAYINDFYSDIEIISENGESFTFTFEDMEDAGFTQKYLDLHNQVLPSLADRLALRAGMYGFGSYSAGTIISIDPTFSEKQSNDEYDFDGSWNYAAGYDVMIGSSDMDAGFTTSRQRYAFLTWDTGITEEIGVIENITMTFHLRDSEAEVNEYLSASLYFNDTIGGSGLVGGFWNETLASDNATTEIWVQNQLYTTYWTEPSFWSPQAPFTVNKTMSTNVTNWLMGNWSSHHNSDPVNRQYIPMIITNGTNLDVNTAENVEIDEAEATAARHPTLTFDYTLILDPEIDSPGDQTYSYGFTNENITWTPTERTSAPDTYVVYRNGSIYDSGSWTNQTPIIVSLDSINTTSGMHNFTIVINDTLNAVANDTVWIEVLTQDYPEIDSPANQTLIFGFTTENITWIPTERQDPPDEYIVYRNGSQFASGFWTNQTPIVISLDSINTTVGNHNFTIVINTTGGYSVSDLVWIEVLSAIIPEIDSPANQTKEYAFSLGNITWTPTERSNSPDNYVVYRNGSVFGSGSWINQTPIVIDIVSINLTLGNHNFTIFINDTLDYNTSDLVWITVQDTTNPIIDSPIDITYEYGDIGGSYIITWNATDLLPNNYTVYKNGTINETGSWLSGVVVVIGVNGLSVGSWNFTIWVNDTSGNSAFDTVFVFVTPAINDPPIFIAWFESSENILPDTDVVFYVEIYDIDNTSSELNVTLYYSFLGFSYQNLSVNLTYVSTVATNTYRFEYTFSGQEAGTDLIFYYVGFDGEFYIYKQDLINLEWQEVAITIIQIPQPDRISRVTPEPDILRIAILVIVVITFFAMILILMAKSRKGKPIKVIRTEVEYIYE